MADQLLVQGTTDCPTILANGPEGYYLGISNGKLAWVPLSTDIALLLRSRSLSISQSGTSNHTADIELGSIDGLSDVDTTTNGPSIGHVLTWNGTEWVPKAVGSHPAAQIVQSDAPFSANPTTQVFSIPTVPILSGDATTGTLTFKPGNGTTVTLDLCSIAATCFKNFRTSSGNGVPPATANDPLIWKDLSTNNVYIRDVTGVVTLVNDPVDISNGDGPPSVVTNDPTIYTDDLTGDIYYRDSSGATVKIYASLSIPITSGNGTPSATANSPTVYEDLLTGSVYYRDTTGNLILLFSRPTPVAAYEYTAKDSTNRIWTFDAVSSTSTGNGATLTTYAWTAIAVGAVGAATIASPGASSTTITFPSAGSWLVTLTVTDSNGSTQSVTKLIEVIDSVLVAAYETTSKIALTAAFDASSSVGAVSYAWTATPINNTTGAVTFGTPAGVTTTASFPNNGEWQITLIATDAYGNTKSVTKIISVDRVLTVNGPTTEINGSWFGKLQDAYDWINTNDSANEALYLIEVYEKTLDVNTITGNQARVHFKGTGQVNVGFSLGAGTFYFSADNEENVHVNLAAGGTAFNILSTTSLIMSHINIVDNAGIGIFMPGGVTQLTLTNCKISGASCACIFIRGAGNVTFRNCYFKSNSSAGNNPCSFFHGCSVEMYDCQVFGGPDSYGIGIGNPGLNPVNFKANNLWVECPGGTLNSRVPLEVVMLATSQVEITNSTFIARGASGNANAYQAVRVRANVAGGKCVFANCVMHATGSAHAFWVQFPMVVPAIYLLNCSIRSETGSAIVSSTGVSNIVGSPWNPANIVECDLHGGFAGGPVTPVAAVLSGGNYTY